ncbi:NADH-dependent flavin oxidoreductase [Bacillus sp. FJAT-18017]|uniref:NADH-dependent flavin oxidoreductase n=1 Tax=Bacillus sp. FJAT-18017 TaxID=1705566 RepID=UPI0006AFCA59|nr:NADH-dependent flavin oxidoreductase [Bacillus sp. FJAT-18017]ALC92171.1 NADH-dependent flavin oxidoreductase [Bacillus sp. FJAT-18017]
MKEEYKAMLEEIALPSGVKLKNRILMAPMTNWSSGADGMVTDDELAYYRERSGGVGAVITACANVTRDGQGFKDQISAYSDEQISSLRRLAETIKGEGAKAILQIFHAGRMSPPELLEDGQPVSASAVAAARPGAKTPRELTGEEVKSIINAFGEATRRAIEAGFDGVEIHGANTYLIQQFFSPHSNRREDEWGGSLEKRMAFPLAVIDSVKQTAKKYAIDPFIVGYRLSPEEIEQPGITMEDTLTLADVLSEQGLDYLHVSTQDFWKGSLRDKSDSRSRVVLIHDRVGDKIPVIGVGSLYSPDDVKKAMAGGVPLIALGRELIVEPKWVEKVKSGHEEEIRVTLTRNDQEKLVVPNPLWQAIVNTPGWFPLKD